MIMPDTKPQDAVVLCERLRKSLEAIIWARHPERKITMSIGIAGVTEPSSHTAQQIIDDADSNLYQAKKSGRNRIFQGGHMASPTADAMPIAQPASASAHKAA